MAFAEAGYAPAVLRSDHSDEVVAAVFIATNAAHFVGTLRRLSRLHGLTLTVGAPAGTSLEPLENLDFERVESRSPAELANLVWQRHRAHVLVVADAVLPPPEFLQPGLDLLAEDLRVATVSFLSNDAAFVSFPDRNRPTERAPEGRDETSVTAVLRSKVPALNPAPLPVAAGPVVLLSSIALSAVGLLADAPTGDLNASIADFCLRGRQRGFIDLLDTTTYCARPSDIAVTAQRVSAASGLAAADDEWLRGRHPVAYGVIEDDVADPEAALGLALNTARVKVLGLRVIVDGSCLGPHEMGTQVTTVALIEALAERTDVREVCVATAGSTPAYARTVLSKPKVSVGLPDSFGRADIVHRPFQPNDGFDVDEWRQHADRIIVTVHDLISFNIGSYSGELGVWRRYREAMRQSLRRVDGVVVVSDDVRRQLELHQMPIPGERVFVVPNGTEHLTGEETARIPDELVLRGFASEEFVLCLGTNYSHKNRDLAVRAVEELRRRGRPIALVLAGPSVPWGSSRALEETAYPEDGVFVLPEVASAGRNWLVRHAAVVLYTTAAEGFGLVPYEAARFGTPTVYVPFGPLAEVGGNPPVVARDWSPTALADATDALLSDPALARRQVASSLEAGAGYTWAEASQRLAVAYRTLLSKPAVR